MPAQAQNGSSNSKAEMLETRDGETFLFTSESVGEGHPGEYFLAIFGPIFDPF